MDSPPHFPSSPSSLPVLSPSVWHLSSRLITSAVPHSNQSLCELLFSGFFTFIQHSSHCYNQNFNHIFTPFEANARLKTPPTPATLSAFLAVSKKRLSAAYPCLCSAFTFIRENVFVGASQAIQGGSFGSGYDFYTAGFLNRD